MQTWKPYDRHADDTAIRENDRQHGRHMDYTSSLPEYRISSASFHRRAVEDVGAEAVGVGPGFDFPIGADAAEGDLLAGVVVDVDEVHRHVGPFAGERVHRIGRD